MYTTTQTLPNQRRFSVAAAASRAWRAAAAVIGSGQAARPDPLASLLPLGVPHYLRAPWSAQELAGIAADERVLVLGTGAAAADVVAALRQQRHVSRRWGDWARAGGFDNPPPEAEHVRRHPPSHYLRREPGHRIGSRLQRRAQ